MITPANQILGSLLLVLLVAALALHAQKQGLERDIAEMQLAWQKAAAESARKAREQEQQWQARADALAAEYEAKKRDIEDEYQALVTDLRAGNTRLRRLWQGCEAVAGRLPGDPEPAGEPDGGASDREVSAARIVRAAAQCDAQVIGLQEYVRSINDERSTGNGIAEERHRATD